MKDDERKSRLHIHLGGLIILIIIVLILFKVDIVSKVQSRQFQKNVTYVEEQAKTFWQNTIWNPIKTKLGNWFVETTNTEIKKIQDNFTKNILKTTDTGEEKIQN
jgi:predicted Holliday junction resolvase-like endonuclease